MSQKYWCINNKNDHFGGKKYNLKENDRIKYLNNVNNFHFKLTFERWDFKNLIYKGFKKPPKKDV